MKGGLEERLLLPNYTILRVASRSWSNAVLMGMRIFRASQKMYLYVRPVVGTITQVWL
jgi:hypothetical protein